MMTDDEIIAVVTARKGGADIQYEDNGWEDCDEDNPPVWDFAETVYRVKPKKPYIARIIQWDSDRLMDDDAPVGKYVELTPEVKALLGDMVDD